jgi:hypothetical protein
MMSSSEDSTRRDIMAVAISGMAPVAHLPLILGILRKLEVAAIIDTVLPPVSRNVLSCGQGVEALLLAILDGHYALYNPIATLDLAFCLSPLSMRTIGAVMALLHPGD